MNNTIQSLFDSLDVKSQGFIHTTDLIDRLEHVGIRLSDPRLNRLAKEITQFGDHAKIDIDTFTKLIDNNIGIVEKALKGDLILPDFEGFCEKIKDMYSEIKDTKGWAVATYIPELSKIDPNKFGISICTIDGQIFNIGDTSETYCIQSTCKPINYCIALEENGEETVHNHIGREPSGLGFNEITLNKSNLPHNPMINAGAIMTASLIKNQEVPNTRINYIQDVWHRLSGGSKPFIDNDVYLSERKTADRNFALAYFMKEKQAFPKEIDIVETLELYFKSCSINLTAEQQAVAAATLAAGGINPISGEKIFSGQTVKNCLSLMYSCGMYDFSGEFAFTIGLPGKSGVSGAVLLVIPNLMGVIIWAPPLDGIGNSVKGVDICHKLVELFNFHAYDWLIENKNKTDPRSQKNDQKIQGVNQLCMAASQWDLDQIKRLESNGVDLNEAEYDLRTPIHLAAAEGQLEVIQYFIEKWVYLNPKDRWGGTPLADAYNNKHTKIIKLLEKHSAQKVTPKGVTASDLSKETLKHINLQDSVRLCWSGFFGDTDELKRLIANGYDLNAADYDGRTALHLAAAEGRIEAVQFLLDKKTLSNIADRWGNTAKDEAVRHGFSEVAALFEENN